jgi:hypothetical protein
VYQSLDQAGKFRCFLRNNLECMRLAWWLKFVFLWSCGSEKGLSWLVDQEVGNAAEKDD